MVPRADQESVRSKDRNAQATTYYSLTGDLHGDIPGANMDALNAINAGIGFSSGGDPDLTNVITIQRVPAGIRSKVQAAVREIDSRSFPGTDYSAETQAIYEFFFSLVPKSVWWLTWCMAAALASPTKKNPSSSVSTSTANACSTK